jgi:hypothetical protein
MLSESVRSSVTWNLKRAPFPPDVSSKEVFLEEYIATLFPPFIDKLIKFLHEDLGLEQNNVILTFFADTIGDDKEVTLFTIGDSWRCQPLIVPIVVARLAYCLEKDAKKEDLPYYYLSAKGEDD